MNTETLLNIFLITGSLHFVVEIFWTIKTEWFDNKALDFDFDLMPDKKDLYDQFDKDNLN